MHFTIGDYQGLKKKTFDSSEEVRRALYRSLQKNILQPKNVVSWKNLPYEVMRKDIMTYEVMTYDIMKHDFMTYDIVRYDILTYNIIAYDIITYGRFFPATIFFASGCHFAQL